jgi:hypothetical protein
MGEDYNWMLLKPKIENLEQFDELYYKDICINCYNNFSSDKNLIKDFFVKVSNNMVRYWLTGVILDISIPEKPPNLNNLPQEIKKNINNENLKKMRKIISNLAISPSPNILGKIKEWILLVDFVKNEYIDYHSGFIINYQTGKIANIVCNRVQCGIIISHNTPQEYLEEYNEYLNFYNNLTKKEIRDAINNIIKHEYKGVFDLYSKLKNELIKINCKSFASYYFFKHEISFYNAYDLFT